MFLWIGVRALFCFFLIPLVIAKCKINFKKNSVTCFYEGLTNVPDYLPYNIIRLDLSFNNFTEIREYAFKSYKFLQEITIRDNRLRTLHSQSFCGVPHIKNLTFSGNLLVISDYPIDIFKPVPKLEFLDIGQNMKEYDCNRTIPYSAAFRELKNVIELHIDFVENSDFGQSFESMTRLKRIKFNYCDAKYLGNDTFVNWTNTVTELHMENCKYFFIIGIDSLRPFPNLSVLDFSGSPVHLIQALNSLYPFQNKSMKRIDFHHVTFPSITEFDYSTVLTREMMKYISTMCIQILDISDNNIITTRNKSLFIFEHPKCFRTLILSANRFGIEQFTDDFLAFFRNMTNLEIFDFSYIPIHFKDPKFLPTESFSDCKSGDYYKRNSTYGTMLKTTNFSGKLRFIRMTHIMADIYVSEVKVNSSSLLHLDISYYESQTFPNITFPNDSNLEFLDISGISSTMTKGKFTRIDSLKRLNMKQTDLYKLIDADLRIYSWAPNLQDLDISYNYISYLKSNTFGNLHYLKYLNLSNNLLQIVPTALTDLGNIKELDLSHNHISVLDDDIRNWIDKQQDKFGEFLLHLKGNPLICMCDTTSFLLWLFKTKASLVYNGNYTCRMTNGQINYTANIYKDFHYHFAECNSKQWLFIGISLFISLSLLFFSVAFVYNFQWRIIFFFYRRFRIGAEKTLSVNFKYDVYVSYCHDSASFVKSTLQPKIEHDWGLSMCCEDKDFLVGASNADLRAMSIHRSRHVIFIVTPSFIENEWSSFEIERAKYEKFTKDLQKMVVIVKDVAFRHIPPELSTVWKDIYLIEWPTEHSELDETWQKLKLWFL